MPDAVEVAIESALLNRYNAFQLGSPDTLHRAQPNVAFTPPQPSSLVGGLTVYNYWLRATFLPAESFALGIDYGSHNQHYGIFQVDVFYGQGAGEYAPGRIATSIIQWFKRGTQLTKDGFTVEMVRPPRRGNLIKDDPWIMIPVSIPYLAFAINPA